jgi:hypothetical protein
MSVARATIDYLSLGYLEKAVVGEIFTVSNVYNYLNLKPVGATQHKYNRELTLGTTNISVPVLPNGTWTESTPTLTPVTDTLKLFPASAYIPRMAMNDSNQYIPLVAMKSKMIGFGIESAIISASGTDPNWTGLLQACSGSTTQDIAAATAGSGSLTIPKLRSTISAVKTGPVSFLIMNTICKDALLTLIAGSYGQPNFITSKNLGSGPVLLFDGIPVIVSDFAAKGQDATTATSSSRVYAVHTDGFTGATLWFDNAADLLGIREVPVNQSDLTEAQVTAKLGFSIMSSKCVASLYGITD